MTTYSVEFDLNIAIKLRTNDSTQKLYCAFN